ncbi:YeiH family protein [Frigidibacter oleivorans]|uniref:YeiH family protein n=1 Tax=Frigidibacter oleivorans TaxID=2487129 RepID=UPI000F8E1BCE|nr:putative sulfate exporter family transporter [Frigidibacter oleivorans]
MAGRAGSGAPTAAGTARALFPGLAVCGLVAITAQFLSEHYGAPAMLMALLLGLALNFLAEAGTRTAPGVEVAGRVVLRLGVALLGARVSAQMLADLGGPMIALIAGGVAATVGFGLVAARVIGRGWRLALLTGGAVAICGASAAMAIAAVLPKTAASERNLAFTVMSVTVLSTVAMVAYPPLAALVGMTPRESGVFLGGTIHDVAQVVGAGFSVSPEVGETATLVKLIRVSMLAPVVLALSLGLRVAGLAGQGAAGGTGEAPPLLPGFVLAFLLLAVANSLGLIPSAVAHAAEMLSRWSLLVAIAGVGIKTSLARMLDVGGGAVALVLAETLFLAVFVTLGVHLLG